ncbi:MAG TPA: hypothetical protein VFZ65_22625 [Planctomycetota bacterium]|nr:hypothetical protein [Planctomycetota bacterium]
MSTRFTHKSLAAAALGIALSLLLGATTTTSPAWSNTAGTPRLDPPAAPSQCKEGHFTVTGTYGGTFYYISWRDNSTNEDGFTFEEWGRNQSGAWVLTQSVSMAANSTAFSLGGHAGPNVKFRVKAFNSSGDSAWSNWAH